MRFSLLLQEYYFLYGYDELDDEERLKMSQGYSTPFSPSGRASPVPRPPWHYVGDYLAIEYRADPAKLEEFLPEGFTLGEDAGKCAIFFSDCQYATDGAAELLDPAVSQYRECLLVAMAQYDGKPAAFMPYIFVDNDNSMLRGHIQGMPKQIGVVRMTRAFPVESPATSIVGPGGRFGATLSHRDRLLLRASVTLREETDQAPNRMMGRLINRRHFADLAAGRYDQPLLHQFVRQKTRDVRLAHVWKGDATLDFEQTDGLDFGMLAPIEIGAGYRYSFAMTIDDVSVVANLVDSEA